GVSEGNGPPSSRGKQFTPRSAAAVGGSELRLRPTLWPNLELDPKDVEAMNWWYSSVEAPLAQALPDARCPYPWLPDTHPPDSHEVLAHLSEPYVFEDWKKTWNHPDDSGFEKWLEAMAEKGLEGQRDFTPRLKAHAYAETPGSSRGLRATAADGSEHGVSPEGLDPPASLASWQDDDSMLTLTALLTDEQLRALAARCTQCGHRPKLLKRLPGEQAEFTGWKFLVDEFGLIEGAGCPDLPCQFGNGMYTSVRGAKKADKRKSRIQGSSGGFDYSADDLDRREQFGRDCLPEMWKEQDGEEKLLSGLGKWRSICITQRCLVLAIALPWSLAVSAGGAAHRPPLSTVEPASLFKTVHRSGRAAPGPVFTGSWGASDTHPRSAAASPANRSSLGAPPPFPTNAWWENAVIPPSEKKWPDAEGSSNNLFQMPYILLAHEAGVEVMQPVPREGKPAQQFYDENFAVSLRIADAETGNLTGPLASSWDELTLTLGWSRALPESRNIMTVPIARGSPYITAEVSDTVLRLSTKQAMRPDGLEVDGHVRKCNGSALTGRTFSITLYQSDMTWLFFAPENTSWICSCTEWSFNLTATGPIHGAVRLALANSCSSGLAYISPQACTGYPSGRNFSAWADLLKQHAGCYATNSTIDYEVLADLADMKYSWGKRCLSGWPQGLPLLQLAWPVHLPLLRQSVQAEASAAPATPFVDVRGRPLPVLGDTWHLTHQLLPDVGLASFRPIAEGFKADLLDVLRGPKSALWNGSLPDKDFDLPLNMQLGAGDTYWSGKMLSRLARLVVIADELDQSGEQYFQDMLDRLEVRLQVWLSPEVSENPFFFDASWGGMIACGCSYSDCDKNCTPHCNNTKSPPELCPAMLDPEHNFGNAWYNDHHFHYGYFVYAAAVVTKYRPAWGEQWKEYVLAIVRDYGNPSAADPSFPVTRHKDWFLGFSWASGVFKAWPRGRNQESASEAIFSYYALYAYGSAVRGFDAELGQQLMDFGRLLTAMETHGADTYWHVRPNSSIYSNYPYKIVGILWENQAQHFTWFGSTSYVISGIQVLPVSPALEGFLDPEWVKYDLPEFSNSCHSDANCTDMGWSWTLCMQQAVVDVVGARECLKHQPADAFAIASYAANGNSLTNSLHWVATRTGSASVADNSRPNSSSVADNLMRSALSSAAQFRPAHVAAVLLALTVLR
ncbi:unnamed protein product, partial [Polarella glacialis]